MGVVATSATVGRSGLRVIATRCQLLDSGRMRTQRPRQVFSKINNYHHFAG